MAFLANWSKKSQQVLFFWDVFSVPIFLSDKKQGFGESCGILSANRVASNPLDLELSIFPSLW